MTSLSQAIRCQSKKIVKFVINLSLSFFNCESTSDFPEILAATYDNKQIPDVFTIWTTFYDTSVLPNLILKAESAYLAQAETIAYETIEKRRVNSFFFVNYLLEILYYKVYVLVLILSNN